MSDWRLNPHPSLAAPEGPVALIVLDGVGIGRPDEGNGWYQAYTPFLDQLFSGQISGALKAHGRAVGMPSDKDMGNSEVGHNAMGAGRIFDQGAKLVDGAVASGSLFAGETWEWVTAPGRQGGTLHLIGLLSDGNVHSHVSHVYALIDAAAAAGVRRIRIHPLLDGRDVGETSALTYLIPLEERLTALRAGGLDVCVASGGGRMVTTMDRYEADWSIVARGWRAHVHGEARGFPSAKEAIETYRSESPGMTDQVLPAFVVRDADGPVGRIVDGDGVVFFNFRGDRAIEITRAFEEDASFDRFDRGAVPRVRFAGMMQYDGDLGLPTRFLVAPPQISRTVGEYLAANGRRQLACSETQKFGHVTYFFNGNRSEKFDETLERYVQVPSDRIAFNQRPWMKAAEITDAVIESTDTFKPDFIRVNFANGDMVGHTGDLRATRIAMETTDLALERLVSAITARGGRCLVTADHGNCEEMYERDRKTGLFMRRDDGSLKPKTSHTLNPVPVAAVGAGLPATLTWNDAASAPGLANISATCLHLLGLEAPEDYQPSLIADG